MTTEQQKRIDECIAGKSHWICFPCANKYSKNPPYNDILTVSEGTCYICHTKTVIGPSRKLFGHYKHI